MGLAPSASAGRLVTGGLSGLALARIIELRHALHQGSVEPGQGGPEVDLRCVGPVIDQCFDTAPSLALHVAHRLTALPAGQADQIITGSLVAALFCLALTLLSFSGRHRVMHPVFALAIISLVLVKILFTG
jgi:hypothetical protein